MLKNAPREAILVITLDFLQFPGHRRRAKGSSPSLDVADPVADDPGSTLASSADGQQSGAWVA
ncbi:hypothetical protein [Deinococcus sp.]|uniref:hypothetical protein n=1 Tax=Deinococcus sp. TaxID=47478 RepID=UPI00391C3616